MANNPFYVPPADAASPLQMLMQGYGFGSGIAKDAQKTAGQRAAEEALSSGDARGAIAALIGAGDYQNANALAQYQNNVNSVYGTPIYGTGPKGETQIGTFDKGGAFRKIDTGDFTPTPGIRTIDTGTGTVLIDNRTGRPVGPAAGAPGGPYTPQPAVNGQSAPPAAGFIPNDVRGAAQQKAQGADIGDKQANQGKAKAALESSVSSLDRMADFAKRVSGGNVEGITGWQGMVGNWPGGQAADTQANVNTLKSQVSFAVLQAMRDASKTGGALGNVSDQEGVRLENNLAALDKAQSPQAFRKAMKDITDWVESTKSRLHEAYNTDYASLPKRDQQLPAMQTANPAQAQGQSVRKSIGGRNYFQVNGQWYQE